MPGAEGLLSGDEFVVAGGDVEGGEKLRQRGSRAVAHDGERVCRRRSQLRIIIAEHRP